MTATLEIRPAADADAEAVSALCRELGYAVGAATVQARLARLAAQPDHAVLVARLRDEVVGWIDAGVEQPLQEEAKAVIGGLVVAERARGCGVGLALLHAVEDWARQRGLTQMRVRSNVIRERAHHFYEREGYARVKTSAIFEKPLPE